MSCATPLPDGSGVTVLSPGCVCRGDQLVLATAEQVVLCSRCGAALEVELENITEPERLILEIASELRTSVPDRIRVFKLLSWFIDYSDTLEARLGATVLRIRVESADVEASYRLVVTSTLGPHIFLWDHENALLVGEGEEDQQLVFNLDAVGVGVLDE